LWAKEFEAFLDGIHPIRDLNNGDFVLVKPHDPLLIPMWMGRTQCDVVNDEKNEFFKMVKV
jgi:hypothetical protein